MIVARCSLFVVRCLLVVVDWLLFWVLFRCLLLFGCMGVRCFLFVRFLMLLVRCSLFVVVCCSVCLV